MDCIIIEDEKKAVKNLESQLQLVGHGIHVTARLDSVEDAVSWLGSNRTDLIFLDVQLGDGLGFEIFDHVEIKTPVIFTTSYDEYLSRAFEVNSISYLLKPIMIDDLKAAIDKYHFLNGNNNNSTNERMLLFREHHQQRFMVKNGNAVKPVEAKNVAYFYVQDGHFLFLVTKDKIQYLYTSTLEILEKRLDSRQFFRISRQFIISSDIIKEVSTYDNSRMRIETEPVFNHEMIVSRHRINDFRLWLDM